MYKDVCKEHKEKMFNMTSNERNKKNKLFFSPIRSKTISSNDTAQCWSKFSCRLTFTDF